MRPANQEIATRSGTSADVNAVDQVAAAAFKALEVSTRTEQFIVGAPRDAHALTISLVAVVRGRVAVHIALSHVTAPDGPGAGRVLDLPRRCPSSSVRAPAGH